MPATIHYIRPNLVERLRDELDLQLVEEAEEMGLTVLFDGEEAPPPAAQAYVSDYLKRPLRTEAEARAARVPKARGLWDALREMVRP